MLKLISRDDIQKNWALVFSGPTPTIEQYRREPFKYDTHPHGLYEGYFNRADVWCADNGFRCRFKGTHDSIKVLVSQVQLIDNFAAQNISYNEDIVYLRGRFDKRGSEILFILGDE